MNNSIENCKNDGVTVSLEWNKESSLYSYIVNVIPQTKLQRFNGSTRVQLAVLYDTWYNVNTVTILCGQNMTTLYYSKYHHQDLVYFMV